MTTNLCFIESSAFINISFLSCQHKYFKEVCFLSLSQVICRLKMGKLCLLQCPQQHWDDNRRSKVWMTLWAGEFNTGTKIFSTQSQKETDSQLSPCCDHCGCVWLWCGWEAPVPTACLPASPFECIGAWGCPTTWLSFPTWWTTTTRTSQPLLWRWDLKNG